MEECVEKHLVLLGRLTALSHSLEDFVGYAISALFERTALQMYSATCYISSTLDGVSPVVELLR